MNETERKALTLAYCNTLPGYPETRTQAHSTGFRQGWEAARGYYRPDCPNPACNGGTIHNRKGTMTCGDCEGTGRGATP